MRTILICLIALLILALPALAQEQTPPDQLYPALQDLNRRLDTSYTPQTIYWSWTADEKYPTSALGCPLVAGQPITPVYGFIITFQLVNTGTTYEYRVSADRQIVVPCTASLLGSSSTVPAGIDSDGDYIVDAYDQCPHALGHETTGGCPYPAIAGDADHDLVQENGADLCPNQFGLQSNRGCPPGQAPAVPAPSGSTTGVCMLAPTVPSAPAREAPSVTAVQTNIIYGTTLYPVLERSPNGSWYHIEQGWISSGLVGLTGDCTAVPVDTSATTGQLNGVCQISPAYVGFANVREWAAYDGNVVAVMRGSTRYTVDGFNYDPKTGNWYIIDALGGWVNERNVWTFGDCTNLPVR